MTRINIVPVEELTDQHLFAEFREIKMVPKALARSLKNKTQDDVLMTIPDEFTLNKGHVLFFYDKLYYLSKRFNEIKIELKRRNYNFNDGNFLPFEHNMLDLGNEFYKDYKPTAEALMTVRLRIYGKILEKTDFYKYYGKKLKL